MVRGARRLISAPSSAPNNAFQTRNSSDRLARAVLSECINLTPLLPYEALCLSSTRFEVFFHRLAFWTCLLMCPRALPQCSRPSPCFRLWVGHDPLPPLRISVGSCVQFAPSSLSPRIQWPFASSTCLDTSEDPCPFASSVLQCLRWTSPQRHVFIIGAASSHGRAAISGYSRLLPWPLRITYCRLPSKFSMLSSRYFPSSTRAVTYMMPNMQDTSVVYLDQLLSSLSNGTQVFVPSSLSNLSRHYSSRMQCIAI